MSLIYFIEAVGADAVKIGWAINPSKRIQTLSTGCPLPLRLLAAIPGCRLAERKLHDQFKASSLRGEWYGKTIELMAFIKTATECGTLPTEIKTAPAHKRRQPEALRAFLRAKDMTREEFGKLVGVSAVCVQKWTNGERIPRPKYFHRIKEVTAGAVFIDDFYGTG